jgi:hypothetical protein
LPHFTLQIVPGGPILTAVVTVSQARAAALRASGKSVPDAVPIQALVDTGASCTCVDPSVLSALMLSPTGSVRINTPSTGNRPQDADQYDVGLGIPGPPGALPFYLATVPVVAAELLQPQQIHALIGRDILSACVLTYNGTMGWFTLAF